jgi:hypothetical protein
MTTAEPKVLLVACLLATLWLVVAALTGRLLWTARRARVGRLTIACVLVSLAAMPAATLVKLAVPSRTLFRHVADPRDHRLLLVLTGAAVVWLSMVGATYLLVRLAGRAGVTRSWLPLSVTLGALVSVPALVLVSWWSEPLRAAMVTPLASRHVTPIGLLGLAVLGLVVSTLRIVGWRPLTGNRPVLALLIVGLLSVPFLGALHVATPWGDRLLARANLIRTQGPPVILPAGCGVFPPDNVWNTPVNHLPVDPRSAAYIASMGPSRSLHPDFGAVYGIPYAIADASTPPVTLDGADVGSGPYRIPDDAPVEGRGRGDAHVIVVDTSGCRLHELYGARRIGSRHWGADTADSYDLRSNLLSRGPSVDAAGLPIFPGLVRYEEVARGVIPHGLRFTTRRTRAAAVWPARHVASSSSDPALPPMGQRFRLRASFDRSGFSPPVRVILTALQEYGMLLADNGGDWFLTGAPDARWAPQWIAELKRVTGADFEAVDTSSLIVDLRSGEARRPPR